MIDPKPNLDQVREDQLPLGSDIPDIEDIPENGDLSPQVEPEGAGPDGDGDDAFEESDEALPDDLEELEINRDPTREERRLGDE